MTPILVSSHVESINGGRKAQITAPTGAVMEFKVEHQFQGAKAADLNLVLFHTKYIIGAPSISNPANFDLIVVHTSRFKIDSPLNEELAREPGFHAQMINIAGAVAQAAVSNLLSGFGLNADVPISRPIDKLKTLPKQSTKKPSKRKATKSQA